MRDSPPCVVRSTAAALLSVAIASAAPPVSADGRFSWDLNVLAELGYDDNWDMSANDPVDGFRSRLTPDVFVRWETDRALVEADVGVRFENYFDLPDDARQTDRQDPFAGIRASYLLPYGAISGSALYLEQSLIDSFFQDGTAVSRRGSQTLRVLTAAWTQEVSERSLVEVTGGYEDSDYSTDALVDYATYRAQVALRHALDERTEAFVSVNGQFYRPDDQGLAGLLSQEQDAYYVQVGATHAITPTWSGVALAGYGRIQNDRSFDNSETGWLGQLGLIHAGEYSRMSFGASRDFQPSGAGELAITNRVYFDATRQVKERWEAGLSAFWADDTYPFESVLTNRVYTDSRRIEVSPRVTYTLSPSWRVGASYRYRWLDQDPARGSVSTDGAADSNAFFLTLTYVPERP